MSKHRAGCVHCARVRGQAMEYRAWREAAEANAERITRGYATERAEFGRLPTFRDYLEGVACHATARAS